MSTTNPDIVLYAFTFVSRAERIIWTLEELGLAHQVVRLDPFKGDMHTTNFAEINPQMKMPTLVHGDFIISESVAIMEYLSSLCGGHLMPKAPVQQARYRQLMQFCATEIEANLWVANQATILNGIYHWPSGSDAEAIRLVKKNIQHLFVHLKDKAYAIDNEFGLADIYCSSLLNWAKTYGVDMPNYIESYLSRLTSRDGAQ